MRSLHIAALRLALILLTCVLLASPVHAQTFAKGADVSNTGNATTTLRAGANDVALVATTSGGLANIDSMTVSGNGISAVACN